MKGGRMKVTVSIKTDGFSAVGTSVNVETFRDVERLGKKLAAYAKSAGKILPDLKEASIESLTLKMDAASGSKRKRKTKDKGGIVDALKA
jgi:hypothetical protein